MLAKIAKIRYNITTNILTVSKIIQHMLYVFTYQVIGQ